MRGPLLLLQRRAHCQRRAHGRPLQLLHNVTGVHAHVHCPARITRQRCSVASLSRCAPLPAAAWLSSEGAGFQALFLWSLRPSSLATPHLEAAPMFRKTWVAA